MTSLSCKGNRVAESEPREATIEIGYPGSAISVNHYMGRRKDGGTYVKPAARAWMDELGWCVKQLHLEDWSLPLHIRCSGRFKDGRSTPDLSNLSKCTCDAIEDMTGINDQNYRWHDGDISYCENGDTPLLWITISESKIASAENRPG